MNALTHAEVMALDPCIEQFGAAAAKLGPTWYDRPVTVAEALKAGVPVRDVLWVLEQIERDAETDRRYRLALADFAAHVLHIFERYAPHDRRPRDCIIAARALARNQIEAAKAARAAEAAEAAEGDARATEAALAAGAAEATESAEAVVAARAALAAGAAGAARAARAAERKWQGERLPAWFSDDEPEDWPLPPKPEEQP